MSSEKKVLLKIIVVAVLSIVAIIVLVENSEEQPFRILFIPFKMPRSILLLVTLALGFAVGVVTGGILRGKKKEEPKS